MVVDQVMLMVVAVPMVGSITIHQHLVGGYTTEVTLPQTQVLDTAIIIIMQVVDTKVEAVAIIILNSSNMVVDITIMDITITSRDVIQVVHKDMEMVVTGGTMLV